MPLIISANNVPLLDDLKQTVRAEKMSQIQ